MATGPSEKVGAGLSHMHQLKFLLPAIQEGLSKSCMFRHGQVGIVRDQGECLPARLREHPLVADDMGDSKLWKPGLTCPQELARATNF